MSAPSVAVTLTAGYLARYVCLVAVYRANDTATPWHIEARDIAGGAHSGVTVDGASVAPFATDAEASAYLSTLIDRGADIVRIWAEPAERHARAYLSPNAHGSGLSVNPA